MTEHDSYQKDCPMCRSVAAIGVRADPLDIFIRSVVPKAYSKLAYAGELTERQQGAVMWAIAIKNCLRRAMAPHPRCHACTVLMGPGHVEAGLERFCGTHTVAAHAA